MFVTSDGFYHEMNPFLILATLTFSGFIVGTDGKRILPSHETQMEDNFGSPEFTVEDTFSDNCTDYQDQGYHCVPYYQCDKGKVVIDGTGLLDIRSGLLDASSSKCAGDLEICCQLPKFGKSGKKKPFKSTTTIETGSTTMHQPVLIEGRMKTGYTTSQPFPLPSTEAMATTCTSLAKEGYSCVPHEACVDGKIVTDGTTILNVRTNLHLTDESMECSDKNQVCCLHPNPESEEEIPKPSITSIASTTARPEQEQSVAPKIPNVTTTRPELARVKPEEATQEPHEYETDLETTEVEPTEVEEKTVVVTKYESSCGKRNVGGISVSIMNQKDTSSAQFGEWPHMCALINQTRLNEAVSNQYLCGCSIIADNVVLTAAHCVHNLPVDGLRVRGGEWDTQNTIEPLKHQDRSAKHVSIHPLFNPINLHYDFALVHLTDPFILAPHIDLACLPDAQFSTSSFIGKNCFATGWGKDKFGRDSNYQVILKKVELDLVPEPVCEQKLKKTRLGVFFTLDKSFTCAGGKPNKDTCEGDGGGPLVCPQPGGTNEDTRYVQVGIVAWGIGCGNEIPGVYANVSEALCFIDWSTRCVEGQNLNYYGLKGCHKWAERELCQKKTRLAMLEKQFKDDEDVQSEDEGKIEYEIENLQEQIEKFEKSIRSCNTGAKVVDCNAIDLAAEADAEIDTENIPKTIMLEEEM